MKIQWTQLALKDAARLYEFIASDNPVIAAGVLEGIRAGTARLSQFPQMGERLEKYAPRQVRRIFLGPYEVRYEVASDTITILRLWHAREQR
jgi:plasmid stabilization system protein ParE